ncbi:hypothetical protein AB0N88_37920, partial [Streptomyces sp. NPDC093516]|uniref:hypothetical protein n=1 Tax=Streptomyces sp. NPDC093516 TaxID=3155304 RepID=UPI00341FAB6E
MTAPSEGSPSPRRPQQRKQVLLRLDPAVYEALARWAGDELRSANAQIEFLLRRALAPAPGSYQGLQLCVADIEAAHAEFVARGLDIS